MFDKDIMLFSLVGLTGDEEMLFPDFSRELYSGLRWTATEDCFIVGSDYNPN